MELTKQQIQRVEHYLNVKNIKYIDVRFEVLDHIVSDIETTIDKNNLDFETAFYKVIDKWNNHLKNTSSWYFGIAHSAPKIIIDKAKNHFKIHFWIMLALSISISLGSNIISYSFSEEMQPYFNYSFKFLGLICLIYSLILFYKKKKEKRKTTYSFILKTQSLGIIFGLFHLPLSTYFTQSGSLDTLPFIFFVGQIHVMYLFFIYFKKHREAVNKYNTIK